jgi:hypothetical protein
MRPRTNLQDAVSDDLAEEILGVVASDPAPTPAVGGEENDLRALVLMDCATSVAGNRYALTSRADEEDNNNKRDIAHDHQHARDTNDTIEEGDLPRTRVQEGRRRSTPANKRFISWMCPHVLFPIGDFTEHYNPLSEGFSIFIIAHFSVEMETLGLWIVLLLLCLWVDRVTPAATSGGRSSRVNKASNGNQGRAKFRPLLPKVSPHPDTAYLLSFQYTGSPEAKKMESTVRRLERELNVKVRRVNVDELKDAQAVLDSIGHFEGGLFPFFYNRRSGQAVTGPTTFTNLLKWATGDPTHEFLLSPDDSEEAYVEERGVTGYGGLAHDALLETSKAVESERDKISTGGKEKVSSGWRRFLPSIFKKDPR